MIKTSGPVPLLALAVLFTIAIFFAYKELSALKAKVATLEKSVPETVNALIEQALTRPDPVDDAAAALTSAYASFADELPEFATEAARAMTEAFAQAPPALAQIKEEPQVVDVTDAPAETAFPESAPAAAEGDAIVVKRRTKKAVAAE